MKKHYLILVCLLLTFKMFAQINSFDLDCGILLKGTYEKNPDNSINYNFSYTKTPLNETLKKDLPYLKQEDLNDPKNKQIILSFVNEKYFQVHEINQIYIRNYNPTTKIVTFDLNLIFSKNNFFENDNQINLMYDNLKLFLINTM